MDHMIEVMGEAQFEEMAQRFISDIRLEVRAVKDETSLQEVTELWQEAVRLLLEHGIQEDELTEGGTETFQPWYWKKPVGQYTTRRILVKATEYRRLQLALESLEPLKQFKKGRTTIAIDMKQPEFENSSEARAEALVAAYKDAEAKAGRLASAMGRKLCGVICLSEGGQAIRHSGFAGDEDWWGDSSRFSSGGMILMAGGAASDTTTELPKPTRTIFLRCRVRFAIE